MKTLLIIRHAKSSWNDLSMPDYKRPLNDRGRKDAPEMARRLHHKGMYPDLILSSPATRAITTAQLMAAGIGYDITSIQEDSRLYHASPSVMAAVISGIDQYDQIWLFAHNPGVTDFANEYTLSSVANIPTCGVFAMEFDIDSWQDIYGKIARCLFFEYPKSETSL